MRDPVTTNAFNDAAAGFCVAASPRAGAEGLAAFGGAVTAAGPDAASCAATGNQGVARPDRQSAIAPTLLIWSDVFCIFKLC